MKSMMASEQTLRWAWCLLLTYAVLFLPADALASGSYGYVSDDSDTIGGLLCGVANWFTGSVGKGIATLAIIIIGIGALMGKVSWGMAIIVGLGVAIVFGAPQIVNELGGDSSCSTSSWF